MFSHKLLLNAIVVSTIFTQICHGMEPEKNAIIPLNDGITTTIPGIISETYYDLYQHNRYIRKTFEKKSMLIDLLNHKSTVQKNGGYATVDIFCPIVFKESAGFTENLGRFNKKEHHEALSAICQKKALYYAMEQGAIFYSDTAQPHPDLCINLNEALQHAKTQEIK